jgi:hypothetical protein
MPSSPQPCQHVSKLRIPKLRTSRVYIPTLIHSTAIRAISPPVQREPLPTDGGGASAAVLPLGACTSLLPAA